MYFLIFFFFNDTATTEIYTLSLHDALPISRSSLPRRGTHRRWCAPGRRGGRRRPPARRRSHPRWPWRSEEHTSELQSRQYLVCRLLLEKKKNDMFRNQLINAQILQTYTPE